MNESDIGVIEIRYGNSSEWSPVIYVGPDRANDGEGIWPEQMIGATNVRFRKNPDHPAWKTGIAESEIA